MNKSAVFEAGLGYLKAGLSVIPIRADGTKAPAIAEWKTHQTQRYSSAEWEKSQSGAKCISVIGGAISGNLEILDFDDASVYPLWRDRVERLKPGVLGNLPIVQTPKGGFHVYYRNSSEVEGNMKLAMRKEEDEKPKVRIETRGEGGYVIAPPSVSSCHPSGKEYNLLQGDLTEIPVLELKERTLLLEVARSFNEYLSPSKIVRGDGRLLKEGRPGDVYNSRFTKADWHELLESHGWEKVEESGDGEYWRRPGKVEPGISASLNYQGTNLFHVFSSNAEPFEQNRAYMPFAAFTLLEHGGDFSAAARALSYGEKGLKPFGLTHDGFGEKQLDPAQVEHRGVYRNLGELLDAELPPVEEVMKYVERGSVTQFVATTSAGKSTFLLNASLALASGQEFRPLVQRGLLPRRVLYVEMEVGAAKSRQAISKMLSDQRFSDATIERLARENLRVFTDTEPYGMPFDLSLEKHLDFLQREAIDFGAEIIVLDNLSMGFALTSENDNQEVARVVMKPLNKLARTTNTAVILVHHTGKPGEKSSKNIDALAGRGASNWGNLSRTVYGLMPATDMGDGYVVLHNGKNKGGPLLAPARLKLNRDTLWFEYLEDASDDSLTAEAIKDFVELRVEASSAEIKTYFLSRGYSQKTIERRIKTAKELNLIWKPSKRAKFRVSRDTTGSLPQEPKPNVVNEEYCC
jgi:hypothetical protein